MRIAHVFKDAYPPLIAGITRYIHDLANAQADAGHAVEVVVAGVRRSRVETLPSGVVLQRCREFGRALSSPLSPMLVAAIRDLDADVVHLHMPNPVGELGALLNRHPITSVVHFHAQLGKQSGLAPVYGPLLRRTLRRASRVIVGSDPMADVPELAGVRHKVHVIQYGISPGLVDPTPAERPALPPLRVLFVGRLVYYKGVDVLLDALRALPDATATLIGDGPLRGEIEQLAAGGELRGRVRVLGALDDDALLGAYRSHHVFVLPSVSRAEAFGLAMAEAMANRLPVISTALGTGTDWVNLDELTGLVVPPGDTDRLAKAIDRLADPGLRATYGAAARDRARGLFCFDRHVERVLDLYEEARQL